MKGTEIIKKYLTHTISETAEYEDDDYFTSYYYKKDENKWLQFTEDSLNVYYPYSEEPFIKFDELGISYNGLEMIGWEGKLYLTLSFENNLDQVSDFVVMYFKNILNIDINEDAFRYEAYEDYPDWDEDDLLNP